MWSQPAQYTEILHGVLAGYIHGMITVKWGHKLLQMHYNSNSDMYTKWIFLQSENIFRVPTQIYASQWDAYIYCKTLYFRCILISRFWNVEILLHFNLAFPSVLLVFTRRLMGKLNFCGYLISRFYPTREIRENLMHAKNMCFTVLENPAWDLAEIWCTGGPIPELMGREQIQDSSWRQFTFLSRW